MAETFKLALVDPSKSEVYEVLGISEERSDEISEIVAKSYRDEKYFTDTLASVTAQMNHINEVVFAVLCAARAHDAKRHHDLNEKLKAMEVLVELLKFKAK